MAIIRLLPNAPHFREFQNDPITQHHYTNTCGETMLAELMVLATPKIESTADAINLMTSLTREMMSLGWADKPNGATQTGYLYLEARRRGFTVMQPYVRWTDPIPSDKLHGWLRQYAGINPIGLMVTNGQALRAIDGSHDEVGLHGHFIAIVGIADEGYITEDGDNSAISDHLVTYPWSVIEAAHVTGFIMLEPQTVENQTLGVPKGWTDNTSTQVLTAPNGVQVVRGFRDYILTHAWPAANWPLEPEYANSSIEPGNPAIGPGSRIDFRGAADSEDGPVGPVSLGYTVSRGVYRIWAGQDIVFYGKALKQAQDALAALKASVKSAATSAINALMALTK